MLKWGFVGFFYFGVDIFGFLLKDVWFLVFIKEEEIKVFADWKDVLKNVVVLKTNVGELGNN